MIKKSVSMSDSLASHVKLPSKDRVDEVRLSRAKEYTDGREGAG